jgi:hypothetical protein
MSKSTDEGISPQHEAASVFLIKLYISHIYRDISVVLAYGHEWVCTYINTLGGGDVFQSSSQTNIVIARK